MTIEQTLLQALTSGSPLPTSAADRVYGMLRPQDQATPAITYQRISNTPPADFDGDEALDNARIQIDCWAETYGAAKTLAREVRAVLATVTALAPYQVTARDFYEDETRLYRVSMDYSLWGSA